MSWHSSLILPWNILRGCMLLNNIPGNFSTSSTLHTLLMTLRLWEVLSVITNEIFQSISCSGYLWPEADDSIFKVVISNLFKISLDSMKTLTVGSEHCMPLVVRDWTIYNPTQLIEEPWETCHSLSSFIMSSTIALRAIASKRVQSVEDYSCLEVCLNLEFHFRTSLPFPVK